MSTQSNSFTHDNDDGDIIAEYENHETNDEHDSFNSWEDQASGDENDDQNEARKVDPTASKKHIVRNPVPKLNTERLKGPKGIQTIEKYFEGFKFHGNGYEKYDLDRVMKRMEHWSHRLFPKLHFDDFLVRVEKLGSKKDLQVFIKKYRLDMVTSDDGLIVPDLVNDEEDKEESAPIDEFDLLIAEQIEKQQHVAKSHDNSLFDKLLNDSTNNDNTESSTAETITTPSGTGTHERSASTSVTLSDEVKERIERNRQQAIQRRLARLQALQEAKEKILNNTNNVQTSIGKDDELCNKNIVDASQTSNKCSKEID